MYDNVTMSTIQLCSVCDAMSVLSYVQQQQHIENKNVCVKIEFEMFDALSYSKHWIGAPSTSIELALPHPFAFFFVQFSMIRGTLATFDQWMGITDIRAKDYKYVAMIVLAKFNKLTSSKA